MRTIALWLIACYRNVVSPALGPCCRFAPTCSRYASEAIIRHGLLRGLWLGGCRLAKCHPFHPGGVDPVPAGGSYHAHRFAARTAFGNKKRP